MKILKQILRLTLFLILSILLILTQMFIITFVISSFQKLVISNNNYLITANNTFYKYIVFFVIVTTYLSLIFFNKKGLVNLSEDITYLGKFIYNKTFIIIFASISILIFICTIFNIDVVYKDKIISHSIFNIKGVTYRYEDINEVHVGIKKNWNNSMSAQYILIFKDHKVDILGTIISVKNEDSPYENNILVDNKIKELNIKKKIDDKYLKQYIKGWNIEASNNLKILFTR